MRAGNELARDGLVRVRIRQVGRAELGRWEAAAGIQRGGGRRGDEVGAAVAPREALADDSARGDQVR